MHGEIGRQNQWVLEGVSVVERHGSIQRDIPREVATNSLEAVGDRDECITCEGAFSVMTSNPPAYGRHE